MSVEADNLGRFPVPTFMLSGPLEDHFVLLLIGDAAEGAGMLDGDYLVMLRTDQPLQGDVVAAQFRDDVLLRRYSSDGDNNVVLSPLSKSLSQPALYFAPGRVEVFGVVVGVMRKIQRGE